MSRQIRAKAMSNPTYKSTRVDLGNNGLDRAAVVQSLHVNVVKTA